MSPTVSIIIPCYNQGRFLSDAINSLLAQKLTNWECIVIDDGSKDNTREVALSFANADPRIRVVFQENRGLSGARNRGLDLAIGKYIQFLDADDLIEPEKLALQVAALEASRRPALSYSDYRFCTEDDVTQTATRGNFPPPRFVMERPLYDIAARWESEFSIPCHCFLFHALFFRDKNIRFDENLPNHEDWDCWMRIFSLDPEIFHIEGKLAIYRLHSSSMCTDREKMWAGFKMAIEKQRRLLAKDKIAVDLLKKKLIERYISYHPKTAQSRLKSIQSITESSLRKHVPWPVQRFFFSIGKRLFKN